MVTRGEMIEAQIKARGVSDPRVLRAMEETDRALFVPDELQEMAYEDRPLPIGKDQTISQPYIVAYMAEQLHLGPGDKVLEIGTGCGYNAAVLSRLCLHVYSIEIIGWLAALASENLSRTGIKNISTRHGDGYGGWPDQAPFDAIVLTAAPPTIPEPLKKQLSQGGHLLAPVGRLNQHLVLFHKTGKDMVEEKKLLPVRFVPMTGEADHSGSYGH